MRVLRGIPAVTAIRILSERISKISVINTLENHGKGLHSGRQCVRRSSFKLPVSTKAKQSTNGTKKCAEGPKYYMRNTIQRISTILRLSIWESAQDELEKLPVKWDSYTVNQTLKTHPPMEKAWLFFNWASSQKGFKHDQYTYTTMLDIFGEAGRIPSMKYVFEQMKEKEIKIDVVTYTSILHWLSKHGDFDGSLDIWEEMKAGGFYPTVVSYTAFMKVLFDNSRPKEAGQVYKEMIESGFSPNCYTYTVLIDYLAGAGKFNEALEIMSEMRDAGVKPDKAMCNILVQKCARRGEMFAMAQTLLYMKENFLVLRYPVFLEALQALKNAGESDDLLREVNPHLMYKGIDEQTSESEASDRVLILILMERQNFLAVHFLLDELTYKRYTHLTPALITTIIQTCCASNHLHIALMAFSYSSKMCIELERPAYVTLIGQFIRSGSMENVEKTVQHMVRAGVSLGTFLICQLIHKFGCAGMLDSAEAILKCLPGEQNVATYTALISSYIESGEVDKGLQLLKDMNNKGIHASSGTFEVLIAGLRESGRLYEAKTYRTEQRDLRRKEYSLNLSANERLCNLLFDNAQALLSRA